MLTEQPTVVHVHFVMQNKVIWLVLLADENIKSDNKHLCFCPAVLCVNSCKVDETAAHHGGEEGGVLAVPVHCFIWVICFKDDVINQRSVTEL